MCLGTVQNNRAQCENSLNYTQLSSSSKVFSTGLILFMVIELNCLIELQLHFYHASNIYTCPSFQVQSASQLLSVGSPLISWRNRLFTHIFLSSSFFFKNWLVFEPLAAEVQSIYQTFSQQMKHVKTTQLQFLLVRVLQANNKDLYSVRVMWEKKFPASTLQQKTGNYILLICKKYHYGKVICKLQMGIYFLMTFTTSTQVITG